MCGIAGVAHTGDRRDLPNSAQVLAHRGPDGGRSVSWDATTATGVLGHDRLAIVDLPERGQQPMSDATTLVSGIANHRRRAEAESAGQGGVGLTRVSGHQYQQRLLTDRRSSPPAPHHHPSK
ncbi:asparagine synthetase B (glutamine-hydrolysing) [Saccharomonospora amisosensis]|uniref:Asparagine synthetase B (Glutamine-hydrolysing) n=1 Tax=Saccharomonospora amisosensis TaxID=1128677 RepID=A0A7X5UNR4_9PSEU|nr:asparagine synthetase B (glutamine-hydrolysing) [Saccharomonospora amisosensis]